MLVITASVLTRAHGIFNLPPEYHGHYLYMRTEFRADSIAYGVALAAMCELSYGNKFAQLADTWTAAAIAAACIVLAVLPPNDLQEIIRDVLFGIAIIIAMTSILFRERWGVAVNLLNSRFISWIGKLSYSLYVWHIPVHMLCSANIIDAWWFSLAASVMVAAISYYCIERPMIEFGRRTSLKHD